jgi:acyl carrier protein
MTVGRTMAVEDTLQRIICKVLHKESIDLRPSATFKELGADSLDVVQVMVAIEEALDIELVDEDLKTIANMSEFIKYIQNKVDEKKK